MFLFRKYERGRFLGKGGFAKCYELKDVVTGEIMAGKIVPKSLLLKSHQKEKMAQEIRLEWRLLSLFLTILFLGCILLSLTCIWSSSFPTSRTITSSTLSWNFVGKGTSGTLFSPEFF